jgi:tetratricopeptide (TPR) repeat protein
VSRCLADSFRGVARKPALRALIQLSFNEFIRARVVIERETLIAACARPTPGKDMLLLRKKPEPQSGSDPAEAPESKTGQASREVAVPIDPKDASPGWPREATSDLRAVVIPERPPVAAKVSIAKTANQSVRRLVIPRGVNFRGEIEGCDRLVIAGALEGEIKACRHLEVLDGGRLEGIAVAGAAAIAGLCRGSLTVEEKLFLARTARVVGSVNYSRLEIEAGGELEGDVHSLGGNSETHVSEKVATLDPALNERNVDPKEVAENRVAEEAAKRQAAELAEIEHKFATAVAALDDSRFDEAEALFKAVIAKSPKHAAALGNLGKLARRRGEPAEALSYFEVAVDADPSNTSMRCDAAALLQELGRRTEAEAIYKSVIEADPKHPGALSALAYLLKDRSESAIALTYFETAITADPGNPSLRCEAANLMRGLGRPNEAEAMFKSVIESHPQHCSALTALGHLARQRRDRTGALGYFEAAAKADPGNGEARCDLANILRELSRFGEAEAMFKTVIEEHPQHVGALAGLGHIARQRGELDNAIGYFETAVKADSQNPDMGCELASVLREASRLQEAERTLNAVVEIHPQHAPALAALGHLARQREDRPATLRWFEAAMAADSHDVSIRVECARALRQKGEFARARQIIEKVLDDDSSAAKA